ncbi:MAG TPA: tetratricopeptide repeat protein [Aquaticitalea sp.]|nr:tetratricopeptide repeat protein [Aquaticitalea sp.]
MRCTLLFCAILVFTLGASNGHAQTSQDTVFENTLQYMVKTKPKTYGILDSLFNDFNKDSLKMKDLKFKAKSIKYTEAECYALNCLGIIYRNISHYDNALEMHQKAYGLAELTGNIELEVISLNMIGVVYRRMDFIKPALDYHKQALDIANKVENPSKDLKASIAVSQNSMGNIYMTLKQYDLAIKEFEKSLILEKEANNRLGLAINYQNLGYADEAQGKLDLALKNYKRSLDYNNQIGSEVGRAICYNSIGQVYIKQKKYADAKIIIEEGLKKSLQIKDQFYIALSYINLGWAQLKMSQYEPAEKNLKTGLAIAENYSLKTAIVDANTKLSELYNESGNHKEAMSHYKDAIELEKTIFNERNMQYVSDIIIAYENQAKTNEIKALASENEFVKSKLERNQKIFWFTLLGLIVMAGLVLAFNRNQQLKQEKQILTLEQDMLRSQMNPHFIFNSLNSIKLYIINNEKENAVYYLNKFSKLIRKILIASTEKEMSLEDELDTMKLYMNIENIRFSNEIDFQIDVENSINISNIRVPSLILQPFLENALWHGLSSKEDDKHIRLQVIKPTDDYITITITDNGIGRQEASRINSAKILKRKSVGIAITRARLANFSKGFTNDYKIDIEDLYDDSGKATGTKVNVNIPIRSNVLKIA